VISVAFFEAAATAIPTLAIAVAFTGAVLVPRSRRSPREARRLSSPWTIVLALGCVATVACAEVIALVTVAAERPTLIGFIGVMAAIILLVVSLASAAVYSIVEPLADSGWAGIEVPLFLFLASATAAASSIALLRP
jgi:hypothetical protein